jgi:hypothetical protein
VQAHPSKIQLTSTVVGLWRHIMLTLKRISIFQSLTLRKELTNASFVHSWQKNMKKYSRFDEWCVWKIIFAGLEMSKPRSTITGSIYARKRPYTSRLSPYTAVFWRFTRFSITIVYLRIVYGRKRSSCTDSVYEGRKRPFFSPYTVVYERACWTWEPVKTKNQSLCRSITLLH